MEGINLLGVLLGAVASMVVGMLWYGPLFGKHWMNMMGFSSDSMKKMKMKPFVAMGLGFVSQLVMSFVAAVLVAELAVQGWSEVPSFVFWLWLGFIATVMLGTVLWEGRSWKLYFFNAAYQLVSLFAMTSVIVLMK